MRSSHFITAALFIAIETALLAAILRLSYAGGPGPVFILAGAALAVLILASVLLWRRAPFILYGAGADAQTPAGPSIKGLMEANEALSERLKAMTSLAAGAVIEVGRNGLITSLDEEASRLTGLEAGRSMMEGFRGEHGERFRALMEGAAAGPAAEVVPFTCADGRTKRLEVRLSAIAGEGPWGCFILIRDPGEAIRLKGEIRRTRQEAAETAEKLRKTISDLEEFALLAVRRELKMKEIRERLKKQYDEVDEKRKAGG